GRDEAPRRGHDRRRVQLRPERVVRGGDGHRGAEAIPGRLDPLRHLRRGALPPRGVTRQGAGPQQLGDLLEAGRAGQLRGVVATVGEPVVRDAGELGGDREVEGGGPAGATRAPAAGQLLHLLRVEPAPATVPVPVAREVPPADVRVERRDLDPEPLGRLVGAQHLHPLIMINVDQWLRWVDAAVMTMTEPAPAPAARGLKGVVVADTALGGVRGAEGFYHYRQHSAVELATTRPFEDTWQLLFDGHLPSSEAERAAFCDEVRPLRALPPGLTAALPALAAAPTLDALRAALSLGAAELGTRPVVDLAPHERRRDALRV